MTLDDALLVGQAPDDDSSIDLVALDRALTALAALDADQAPDRRAQILRWTVGRGNGRGARDLAGHRQTPLDDRQGVAAAGAAANELAVTNADWTRVNALFHQALELPRDQRGAFLAQACGGDEPLRLELASLLDAHDRGRRLHRAARGDAGRSRDDWRRTGHRRPHDRALPDRPHPRRWRHGRRLSRRRHAARPSGRPQSARAALHAGPAPARASPARGARGGGARPSGHRDRLRARGIRRPRLHCRRIRARGDAARRAGSRTAAGVRRD